MAKEDIIWIGGDSSTFTLESTGSADRRLEFLEGLGLPALVHQAELFPFIHGSLDLSRAFRDRRVRMSFRQWFSTFAALEAGRQAIASAFNPDKGAGQLKYIDASSNDWRLDCWVVELPLRLEPDRRADGQAPLELHTMIELWAPWPLWRKATGKTTTATFSGTSNVDTAVTNSGHCGSIPNTITITGQATNPVISIIGTTKKIDLRHTVAVGETATLTCFPVASMAAVKGATNLIGSLTYDSSLVFEIPRGASTVRITGGNAGDNGVVTLSWSEWYLAV